jgi:uncharacterized protein YktB (UPF0637 family)
VGLPYHALLFVLVRFMVGMLENEVFLWFLIISAGVMTVVLAGLALFAL